MSISPVFNVSYLFPYGGTFEPPVLPSSISAGTSSTPVPRAPSEDILDVLDNEIVTSPVGGFCHFVVCWKNRTPTDDTWLSEEDFRCLDPDLLDDYMCFISSEPSYFQPRGNDGDRQHGYNLRPNPKRKIRD